MALAVNALSGFGTGIVAGGCTPDYSNTGGTGDRQSIITVTEAGWDNALDQEVVDGITPGSNGGYFTGTNSASLWVKFDFKSGNAVVINEFRVYHSSATATDGNWRIDGSNNDSDWDDLSGTVAADNGTGNPWLYNFDNTEAYRYYRHIGVSGTNAAQWHIEWEFQICGLDQVYQKV